MKKIELVKACNEENPGETLGCRVLGVPSGSFTVRRCGASDEAWEAVKERLFGDPSSDLPEGVVRYVDGRLIATGEVATVLREQGWTVHFTAYATSGALAVAPNRIVEVRPPSTPRTERVAATAALDRLSLNDGPVMAVGRDEDGEMYVDFQTGRREYADLDGMVTVLTEDGPR